MMKVTRLFEYPYLQAKEGPLEKAISDKVTGKWRHFSTQDILDMVNKASRGLLKMGVKPGDKLAIISYQNRAEWMIMDLAMQQLGVIDVPLYPTISARDYVYIMNDAGVSYAFVGAGDLYDKVKEAQAEVPTLKDIYTFDQTEGRKFWKDIFSDEGADEVEACKANIKADDLATLIYTSGTTGNPKGVMLTHTNIISNADGVLALLPIHRGEKVLSFLPLCHIFERAASYVFMQKGAEIYFTGTDNLGGEDGDLRTVAPHYFNTVPRLLEKVYEKIYNKGLELDGVKKKLFFWALSRTDDFTYQKTYSGLDGIKQGIADKLIFSKWREALGGNIKGILTGAAPCPSKILRVFSGAGIPIREAYGLTETSPGLTINRFEVQMAKVGTVGPPLEHVDIYIDSSDGDYAPGEGEILARGPNIMQGYYNKPDKTAEVFKEIDGERWFCTGDIGKFVEGSGGRKFLKITDRKKELLKTSGGKYVAPAPIENKFKESFLIEQMMVVGDKQKFVSALIVPAEEALKDWMENNGISYSSLQDAVTNEKVVAEYERICHQFNPQFSHIEQIKKIKLIPDTWEPVKPDGSPGELTPTMKLKRRVILKKFEKEIEEIYG